MKFVHVTSQKSRLYLPIWLPVWQFKDEWEQSKLLALDINLIHVVNWFPPIHSYAESFKRTSWLEKMYWTFHYTTAEANFNFLSGHQTSLVTCSGENLLAPGDQTWFFFLPWTIHGTCTLNHITPGVPSQNINEHCSGTFLITISSPCLFICLFVYSCSFHRPSGITRWCDFAQSTSNHIQSHNSRKIA